METLSVIVGAVGTVSGVASFQIRSRRGFIVAQVIANAGAAASYVLLGLDRLSGGLLCFAAVFQCLFNYYFEKEKKPIPGWSLGLFFALYVCVTLIPVFRQGSPSFPYDFCPFFCAVLFLGMISAKKGSARRLYSLANCLVWIFYDCFGTLFPWANFVTHLVMTLSAGLGLIRFDLPRKKRRKESE